MEMPPGSCFIADDLSGALEVGGLWHEQGQPVRLVIDPANCPEPETGQITGYDLNTRQMTETDAVRVIRDQLHLVRSKRQKLLYKKIDSTLRGWIQPELQAIVDTEWPGVIFFCPANPAASRTVEDELLLVNGVPVHQTALNRDPAFPVKDARIPTLFEEHPGMKAHHCPLSILRQPFEGLVSGLDDRIRSGARLVSFDAVTDHDLQKIARCAKLISGETLLCGSGALASAMGRIEPTTPQPARASQREHTRDTGPGVAFLLGTAHPATRDQIIELERSREIHSLTFDPVAVSDWPREHAAINRRLENGPVAVFPATNDQSEDRSIVARAIQEFYRQWSRTLDTGHCCRLFVTGGETARTVIEARGFAQLELSGNLEPGVAVTRVADGARKLTLVTKPGGYGNSKTLISCYDFLTR